MTAQFNFDVSINDDGTEGNLNVTYESKEELVFKIGGKYLFTANPVDFMNMLKAIEKLVNY